MFLNLYYDLVTMVLEAVDLNCIPMEYQREVADFFESNADRFKHIELLSLQCRSELFSAVGFPYLLKEVHELGVEYLILTAASSYPSGFVLKELDKLMYPEQKLKFITFEPRQIHHYNRWDYDPAL